MRFSISLYLLGSISFFVDFIDLVVRLYLRRGHTWSIRAGSVPSTSVPLNVGEFTTYEAKLHLRPYAILVSVHNAAAQLDQFLQRMRPFRQHLRIIDDASTDDTWQRLQQANVHCIRSAQNQQKPAALKTLISTLPAEIETLVILDPDSRILTSPNEFERVLFEFQRSGMGALCPRLVVRTDGWLGHLQRLEYALAFSLGRKSLADFTVTSGIAVYRRDALERVLDEHSLSVYAEDLENAIILLTRGDRIYYDGRLAIETEVPRSPGRWFSQRVGWQFGLMRVYTQYWRGLLKRSRENAVFAYQYIVYIGIFVLGLHPLKILALPLLFMSALNGFDNLIGTGLIPDTSFTNPVYFVAMYLKYTLLMTVAIPLTVGKYERRSVWACVSVYTVYALAQIVPATVGYVNWFSLRFWGRRLYRDHYQPASV